MAKFAPELGQLDSVHQLRLCWRYMVVSAALFASHVISSVSAVGLVAGLGYFYRSMTVRLRALRGSLFRYPLRTSVATCSPALAVLHPRNSPSSLIVGAYPLRSSNRFTPSSANICDAVNSTIGGRPMRLVLVIGNCFQWPESTTGAIPSDLCLRALSLVDPFRLYLSESVSHFTVVTVIVTRVVG